MHPTSLEEAYGRGWNAEDPTSGESRFFLFARDCLKPDAEFSVWFQPLLFEKDATHKPDFVLYHPAVGLVVAEVKDWRIAEIEQIDTNHATFRDARAPRTNPLRQVETHVSALRDRLREAGLVAPAGPHRGKPLLPISGLVVLPYITRHHFEREKLHAVLPLDRLIFGDEMAAATAAARGKELLLSKVEERLRFAPPALTARDLTKLGATLWPSRRIALPARQGAGKWYFQSEVNHLDALQGRVAYRLGHGHCLLKGGAGTGKTLILVERCRYLLQTQPKMKRLLIVCFNIALASYIRRLVEEGRVGSEERPVEVTHFFELCSRVLGEPIKYEGEKTEYFQDCRSMMLEAVQAGQTNVEPYDAICIDEAQDLDELMLAAIVGLLRKGGDLLIATDPEQTLYRRRFSWKSIGVDVDRSRTVTLTSAYRGTVELRQFAARLLGRSEPDEESGQLSFAFPAPDAHGEQPLLRRCANDEAQAAFVAEEIADLVGRGEYRRSEIAVIYDDKVYGPAQGPDGLRYGSRDAVRRLELTLKRRGVPVRWVSRDYRAKEEFDVTTDRVTLVSVHSAKGLDFDLVYLLPQEQDPPPEEERDALRRLYVGVTRARHRLVVPFVTDCAAVRLLERASKK